MGVHEARSISALAPRVLATRSGFVRAATSRFDAAGIAYAFLHATEESDKDSDVDLVVDHRHLAAVEAIVRSGELGMLVQRMDYDVPWCRYYILATGDRGRRFRQLDVASDPYGISRYGLGVRQALAGTRRIAGIPVLRPASLVVYVATKRARKGIASGSEADRLRQAYASDPLGAQALLLETWGSAGTAVATALAQGSDLEDALALLAKAVTRSRRMPRRLVLRAGFEMRRHLDRLRRQTGLVVQLVGPDGSGKSTMTAALTHGLDGAFRSYRRLHLGPGLLPPPARLLGRPSTDPTTPHGRTPNGLTGSFLRIGYLATDALLGWLPRVWLPRVRSGLVLVERGWDDLRVDPARYRLGAWEGLVRGLANVVPRSDLTILLTGDPRRMAERKPELAESEIERQIIAWRRCLDGVRRPNAEVDTTQPGADETAVSAIVDHLARRAGDLSHASPAVECLGEPAADGRRYAVVRARAKSRWLLPRGVGARGPRGVGLYRPASARHGLGALLLGAVQRLGGHGFDSISLDLSTGLGPEIAAALDTRVVELACLLPTDPARRARVTFSVLQNGRPIAIAKVALAGLAELARERDVLTALMATDTGTLTVPKVLASFVWRRYEVLVTSVVPSGGGADRGLASPERRALVELVHLTPHLEPALGHAGEQVLIHGDFTAWNTARHGRGRLAVWDWERARYGLPLEDYFHWQTQRLVHFGRGSVAELVASALTPTREVLTLYEECGFEADRRSEALVASLRAGLITATAQSSGSELRRDALRLLEDGM